MSNSVKISVAYQGAAQLCGTNGYMSIKHDDVCAFYIDGWGPTGRIYTVASSSSVFVDGKHINCPSLTIDDGTAESELTEIYFPEFEGWDVHSTGGGKSMAVCLVKNKF